MPFVLSALLFLWASGTPPPTALSVSIDRGTVCMAKGSDPIVFSAVVQGGASVVRYEWYVKEATATTWPETPLVSGTSAVSMEWANYTRQLKVVVTEPGSAPASAVVGIQYGGPNGIYCPDASQTETAEPDPDPIPVGIYLAPNPTAGRLQLVLQVSLNDVVEVTVYDVLGRAVRSEGAAEVTSDAPFVRTLDVAGLAPGVYRVVARGGYGAYSQAFTRVR